MKLKNVVVGSEIEVKHDTRFFKKGDLVKVMDKEDDNYRGEMTLKVMDSNGDTLWVNHKDFRRPRPKKLDQSVFDGLDEKWRFAARCLSGKAIATESEPRVVLNGYYCEGGYLLIGEGYDASNWKNSLIERESKELTGSDLCRAMLERGDKYIMCFTSCASDDNAISNGRVETVIFEAASSRWNFETVDDLVLYAVPINNQGEPLTAKDVGL